MLPSRRIRHGKPQSANTRSIGLFSVSTSAMNCRTPWRRARDTRWSNSNVPTPWACTVPDTATSASVGSASTS
jgi:hypothetical protein